MLRHYAASQGYPTSRRHLGSLEEVVYLSYPIAAYPLGTPVSWCQGHPFANARGVVELILSVVSAIIILLSPPALFQYAIIYLLSPSSIQPAIFMIMLASPVK